MIVRKSRVVYLRWGKSYTTSSIELPRRERSKGDGRSGVI